MICLNKEKRESKFVDASCQASQNNLSSTENKKYLEVELIVNEEATQRLLNYQGKFHEVCLSNPIYKSKNSNKPWELVAWYVFLWFINSVLLFSFFQLIGHKYFS